MPKQFLYVHRISLGRRGKVPGVYLSVQVWLIFDRFKVALFCATHRAAPIIGNLFKRCARSYTTIRIAYCRGIDPAAGLALILLHLFILLNKFNLSLLSLSRSPIIRTSRICFLSAKIASSLEFSIYFQHAYKEYNCLNIKV